ncbi:MAG TPA: hypothetical protein VMK12_33295 [Anaeromyxobacteraceae bacterium]|nr:hypothetical protein [Anaeromyxobacteraceae bacterium]
MAAESSGRKIKTLALQRGGPGRKATVAAVYDLTPQARRPEDVLGELRPVRDISKARPRAGNKRLWASVEKRRRRSRTTCWDLQHRRRWVGRSPAHARRQRVAVSGKTLRWSSTIRVLECLWDAVWGILDQGAAK